jgi:DNA topoisomerase-1
VVAPFLAEDEAKLYKIIWNRFVASQMTPAVFDQTTIDVDVQGKDGAAYMFRATGQRSEIRRISQGLLRRQGPEG